MVARSCMFRPNIELEVFERIGAIKDFVEKQRPRLIAKQQTEAELVIIYLPTTREVDKVRQRAWCAAGRLSGGGAGYGIRRCDAESHGAERGEGE
eukprot:424865-Pleurochrysis_carterae.AAC.1